MALNEDLAERIRAILAGTGSLREVRMLGGLCFMLNGNMVAGTSKRGLLVRVGKGQHEPAFSAATQQALQIASGAHPRALGAVPARGRRRSRII